MRSDRSDRVATEGGCGRATDVTAEARRIRSEYIRRRQEIPPDQYSPTNPATLFMLQQRERHALAALRREGLFPLAGNRVLEVGCGSEGWLRGFESYGCARQDLAGIDLDPLRVEAARRKLAPVRDEQGAVLTPGADIRCGCASSLPWDDGSFDLVVQSTVLTSVLDPGMRRGIAAEMARVLRLGGRILWYDFAYNNPRNANVRGIDRRELRSLFPGCEMRLKKVTLAPPIARRVAPSSWLAALLLESMTVLNTHLLAIIRKA
jgi:SAM-dependent methyltransferase